MSEIDNRSLIGIIEQGYIIICNAYGGDWFKATPEWREAAEEYRDAYHWLLETSKKVPTDAKEEKGE